MRWVIVSAITQRGLSGLVCLACGHSQTHYRNGLLPTPGAGTPYLFGSVHSLALAAKAVAITTRSAISCWNLASRRTIIVIVVPSFICWLVGFVYRVIAGHGSSSRPANIALLVVPRRLRIQNGKGPENTMESGDENNCAMAALRIQRP